MNARATLFDLYGEHLRTRGGTAPVTGLIKALATLDIAAPAVRTAVSRMVRQGWLDGSRRHGTTYYTLTGRAVARLDEAAERIYRTRAADWDGHWHLLVLPAVRDRSRRDRIRAGLRYLGYGAIDDTTWIAPRRSTELDALLTAEDLRVESFTATHDADTQALVAQVWDLDELASAYDAWLVDARAIVSDVTNRSGDDASFAAGTRLLHGWRKFLFVDPQLPAELLPTRWPGTTAASYFDEQTRRLHPAAARFVDECMIVTGDTDDRRA